MTTEPEKPSLESLTKRLEALKKTQGEETMVKPSGDAAKAAIDFASASAVGCLLGYGIDRWLDSSPWGLLGGLMLGFAAGVKLMLDGERKKRTDTKKDSE